MNKHNLAGRFCIDFLQKRAPLAMAQTVNSPADTIDAQANADSGCTKDNTTTLPHGATTTHPKEHAAKKPNEDSS